MANSIPSALGDVLILATGQSFIVHAVGRVSYLGQQDFRNQTNINYVVNRASAMTEAKTLLVPGRRIFFRNIDSGDWCEIAVLTLVPPTTQIGRIAQKATSAKGERSDLDESG